MRPRWQIVEDVAKGTLHLRECRQHDYYLPREEAEDIKDYINRKKRAVLFNAFERTIHGLAGMVFRKEPDFSDDVPEVIAGRAADENTAKVEGLAENIDNSGTHWTVFAKEAFTAAIRDGHSFILVDMPPALGEGATLADERAAGRRPYWITYSADQAVNWRVASINGEQVITQITFKECSYEQDGIYGEKEVVRYRVLRPGEWELWREVKPATAVSGATGEFILEDAGFTSLDEIPLAVIYSRKTGYLTSRPPLLDLALLNVCHYQKYSDYSSYLHIASRPILWFRGRNTGEKIAPIGPYATFDVSENGEVAFAETTGAALGAAREDLQDLEKKMAALGLSIIAGKAPQPNTATEELLDHVQEESDLATAARSLKDGIERALYFTALYLDQNAETGGSIELGATMEELTLSDQELQAYSNMQAAGQLSLQTFWALLERAGKLPEDFDPKEEQKLVDAEKKAKQDAMTESLKSFERGEDNFGG